jgi:hypothetical protein
MNEVIPFSVKWMKVEFIMLSDISQVQNEKGHTNFLSSAESRPNIFIYNTYV